MANRVKKLVRRLTVLNMKTAAAESCTAGLAADLLARIPGASKVLWGSFVCYTPEAKIRMLGVGEDTLKRYGAVSRETACEMAKGALEKSGADFAFSITGVAGPGMDGSIPAGTVWISAAHKGDDVNAKLFKFRGSRNTVRRRAAKKAIDELLNILP
ncbi:MAG: CinA family protein [Treponema sp.]|nr:CinA family protein [Treponema sp.]